MFCYVKMSSGWYGVDRLLYDACSACVHGCIMDELWRMAHAQGAGHWRRKRILAA
ncbi:unnamed protein product [Chondrus crispus]|uniref:Uncharacterized protein n=1 Tax=Chondrus crispus TaxID=2769 RepID=R7QDD8_CHOCR|nr:unnamed protein product [Chondrus crispus]CDF35456.1 unnamed protein product [Chondrus crispus]|eukprot:XP_005715275.1 unnamed protein product [Chondrus crispus]